jgi:hypothetical protein
VVSGFFIKMNYPVYMILKRNSSIERHVTNNALVLVFWNNYVWIRKRQPATFYYARMSLPSHMTVKLNFAV